MIWTVCLFMVFFCIGSSSLLADTIVSHMETRRDYDLTEIDGNAPTRPLRFYIGENSAFAICGRCLCGTGIMKGRYPKLRIRPTSASPACSWDSPGIKADSPLVEKFFSMTRVTAAEDILVFSNDDGKKMRFKLGGSKLSPP